MFTNYYPYKKTQNEKFTNNILADNVLINKDAILFISCIFGKSFNTIYKCPVVQNNYFFTNNPDLKDKIIEKGWKYVFVNVELSNCSIKSSLQSKYIKFLKFLKDYKMFTKFNQILYFDHKFNVCNEHINNIINISYNNNQSCIIIREHENLNRKNVWDEINDAIHQERYNKNMNKIIELINNTNTNKNVKVCNTGIIFYNNYNKIEPMLTSIYNTCILYEQPECQIIWCIYASNYLHLIKTVPFVEINPVWQIPPP